VPTALRYLALWLIKPPYTALMVLAGAEMKMMDVEGTVSICLLEG